MKNLLRAIIVISIFLIILYIYARFIEPNMLSVSYINIENENISENGDEIKILQFSDTHLSEYFDIKSLKKVVDKINSEKPDIVFFTGDLIDHYRSYNYKGEIYKIWETLGQIEAPMGKFAVYGNHDYGGGAERVYAEIMEKSGFNLLINSNVKLKKYNINVVGLDDSIFGEVDKQKIKECNDKEFYNIVLSHEPDVVDGMLENCIDLFLSGHSHGGQVNLPFISPMMLPSLGSKYVRGTYNFENARDTMLYVNVGIGTSQLPLRFMAIPELTVFTLRHSTH